MFGQASDYKNKTNSAIYYDVMSRYCGFEFGFFHWNLHHVFTIEQQLDRIKKHCLLGASISKSVTMEELVSESISDIYLVGETIRSSGMLMKHLIFLLQNTEEILKGNKKAISEEEAKTQFWELSNKAGQNVLLFWRVLQDYETSSYLRHPNLHYRSIVLSYLKDKEKEFVDNITNHNPVTMKSLISGFLSYLQAQDIQLRKGKLWRDLIFLIQHSNDKKGREVSYQEAEKELKELWNPFMSTLERSRGDIVGVSQIDPMKQHEHEARALLELRTFTSAGTGGETSQDDRHSLGILVPTEIESMSSIAVSSALQSDSSPSMPIVPT